MVGESNWLKTNHAKAAGRAAAVHGPIAEADHGPEADVPEVGVVATAGAGVEAVPLLHGHDPGLGRQRAEAGANQGPGQEVNLHRQHHRTTKMEMLMTRQLVQIKMINGQCKDNFHG